MQRQQSDRRAFLGNSFTLATTVTLAGCTTSGRDVEDETGSTTSSPRTPVSFTAPHGERIEATSYGSGECAIVLVPQINMDRGSWRPLGNQIAERGNLALAIDEDPDDRAASVRGAVRIGVDVCGSFAQPPTG